MSRLERQAHGWLLLAALAAAPVPAPHADAPPPVVTPVQEAALGEKALARFLEGRSLVEDEALDGRLQRIGERLAAASDRPQLVHRFLAVEGDERNAWSFPGGAVCVSAGLARLYAESDDELAFAIAHELAHVALRHQVERLRLEGLLGEPLPADLDSRIVASMTARFDSGVELEADRYGALYLVRSGYRYTAAIEALERLARDGSVAAADARHPPYDERLQSLRDLRPELERAIEAFSLGTAALRANEPSEAVRYLGLFVAQFPSSVAGRVNLGAAYLSGVRLRSGTAGGLAESLPFLPEPDVVLRGTIDRGGLELARRQFDAALSIDRDSVEALAGLALVHVRLGRLPDARAQMAQAHDLRPDDAALVLVLGNVEYLAGRYEVAADRYERALELRPQWPEATKNLALAAERRGRIDEARLLWDGLARDSSLADEARRRLAALADEARPVEALLSGTQPGAPLSFAEDETTEHGGEPLRLRGIGGLAPASSAPGEIGRALLRVGDVHRAVVALEAASELHPRDARVAGDLAAALLARASEDDRPEDLVRALAVAERGSQLGPTVVEVAFNRAVALDRLFLDRAALEAWRDLESRAEPGSPAWRTARARVSSWMREPVAQEPIEARIVAAARDGERTLAALAGEEREAAADWIDERVIRRWSEGALSPSDPLWHTARALAHTFASALGDRAPRDALETVEEAQDEAALRRALRAFFTARDHGSADESEAEARAYESMLASCPAPCRPFAPLAELRLAILDYRVPDYDGAARRLEPLLATEHRGYPTLAGEAHWMLGLVETRRGKWDDARRHYREAERLFERAAARGKLIRVYHLRSEVERVAGNRHDAWSLLCRALAGRLHVPSPRAQAQILYTAGVFAEESGYPDAAVRFHDVAIDLAIAAGDAAAIAQSSLPRALLRSELGDDEGALADLQVASRRVRDLPPGAFRDALEAELESAEGHVRRRTEPALAVRVLDRALEYFRGGESDLRRASLLLDRGVALDALGRSRDAERDLLSGIEGYERHRERLSAESRIPYFDRSRELFEAMVELQLARFDDPAVAWAYAERARGRQLADLLAGAPEPPPPLPLATIGEALPPATALVSYLSLDDRLIAWVLTRRGLEHTVSAVPADRLNRLVADFLERIAPGGTGDPAPIAGALHDLLLRPLDGALAGISELVVVPDGALHRLPFAALLDARTGRFVVEDRAVTVAPSGTVLVQAMRNAAREDILPRALVLGDPAFSAAEFPDLGRLAGAREEARRIAATYPASRVLIDREATREALLELAGTYDVLHFAGHAIDDVERPERSRLALAPGRAAVGTVSARDLYALDLDRTRLVVLGACSTASGMVSRGEGALSLARPFLAAGAPSVVATYWSLDDEASSALFERLHAEWNGGRRIGQALRAAQLALLEERSPPAVWAAAGLFGSPSLRVTQGEGHPGVAGAHRSTQGGWE